MNCLHVPIADQWLAVFVKWNPCQQLYILRVHHLRVEWSCCNTGGNRLQRKTCSCGSRWCNNGYMYFGIYCRTKTWMCVAPLASEVLSPPEGTNRILVRSLLTMSYAGIECNFHWIGHMLGHCCPLTLPSRSEATSRLLLWTFGKTSLRFDRKKAVSSVRSPWIFLAMTILQAIQVVFVFDNSLSDRLR